MTPWRTRVFGGLCALFLSAAPAFAGPIADFEAALGAAYAEYRTALFRTNQKDKAATDAAITSFETKWRELAVRWGATPPPHLSEDAGWKTTLDRVRTVTETAKTEAAAGDLAKAHETLEAIRDEIGTLRARNGLVSFSDYMNAYHEKMEEVLLREDKSLTQPALGALREQAAVLAYLVKTVERNASAKLKADSDFMQALGALDKSVSALLEAARSGDATATQKAIEALKPAYSRMFLRFG
jgi:hypothetical protein